jgi:hypothetical protein
MGDAVRKAENAGDGWWIRPGLAFGLREEINGEVFGRGGSFPAVVLTANGDF